MNQNSDVRTETSVLQINPAVSDMALHTFITRRMNATRNLLETFSRIKLEDTDDCDVSHVADCLCLLLEDSRQAMGVLGERLLQQDVDYFVGQRP
ncbi:hypothetical protein [Pseudomonas sp. R5(2019)]|uniref:hypothetical protein n=1 Tax=Pseudomonas sp. R5(2019) TaxID=2697566 RepID=UPI001412A675|nr:hypothetical protein [Pseudomonas sp. R5(2019)]NBA95897.1 hypothetical protein [Pseudomonas sp. R5(2019)]